MKFIKDYYITILLSGIVLFLSLYNVSNTSLQRLYFFENEDKLIHFLMYFGVSISFLLERYIKTLKTDLRFYLFNIYPILLGGFIEILQNDITSYRSGDWHDFYADVLGVVFANILFLLIKNNKLVVKYINFRRS